MGKKNIPIATLVKGIAKTLDIKDLTAKESKLLGYAVATLFGYEVSEVGERVANEIHARLPKDSMSRRLGRAEMLKAKFEGNSSGQSVLRHVIFTAGIDADAERAEDVGLIFCWIIFGLEIAPKIVGRMEHL